MAAGEANERGVDTDESSPADNEGGATECGGRGWMATTTAVGGA